MIVSTASIIAQADATHGPDNLPPVAGTWRNLAWDQASPPDLRWGVQVGKFTFKFEKLVLKFTNLTPTVPVNAQIISAVLRMTAVATSTTAAFFTVIRTLATDGAWNLASLPLAWRTASAGGPLANLQTDMDVTVLDVFATTLVDTAISTTHRWAIRDNAASRGLKAGQGVEIVTGGTLGFVDITVSRVGAVAVGDVFAEIYSQDANGLADTLLATSDTRAASTMPTSIAARRFTFSGVDQIVLSAGQDIVVVLNGDYPVSDTENIGVGWTQAGYAPGTFQLFGTGVSFDDQNYPMQRNFRNIPGTGFVLWVAPQFISAVEFDTPELAAMLQSHIQTSGYVEGDPLGFSIERSLLFFPSGSAFRQVASIDHATELPFRLIVEWRQPISTICLDAEEKRQLDKGAEEMANICLIAEEQPLVAKAAEEQPQIDKPAEEQPQIDKPAEEQKQIDLDAEETVC